MLSRDAVEELALANQSINALWLEAMSPAGLETLDAPQKAFFRSIFGTWNHLLLTDRLWLGRFSGKSVAYGSLGDWLCGSLPALLQERAHTDAALLDAARGGDPAEALTVELLDGQRYHTPRWRGWLNMTAHQHHHRGQIHQMCHEVGIALPYGGLTHYYLHSGGYAPLA